tara:strand:- start:91 stop:462 length:372 start_codon:yes stop_codon:yes gene_type:complete
MNCITLLDQAKAKLKSNNLPFIDKTEIVLGLLRSKGILPINRASMNGHLHTTYSAMLVEAHEQGTTVDIPTRKQSDLHELGLTTMVIKWFDAAVEQKVLIPTNGASNAQGELAFGCLFKKIMN